MTKKLLYACIISCALSSAAPAHAGWWSSLTQSISTWFSQKNNQKTAAVVASAVTAVGVACYFWKWWQRPKRTDSVDVETQTPHEYADAQTTTDRSLEREHALNRIIGRQKNKLLGRAVSQWRQKTSQITQADQKRNKAFKEVATQCDSTRVRDAAVQTQQEERKVNHAQTQTDQVEQKKNNADAATMTGGQELGRASIATQTDAPELQRATTPEHMRAIRSLLAEEGMPVEADLKDGDAQRQRAHANGHANGTSYVTVQPNGVHENEQYILGDVSRAEARVAAGETVSVEELAFLKSELQKLHQYYASAIAAAPQAEQSKLRDLYLGLAVQWPEELERDLKSQEAQAHQNQQDLQSEWQVVGLGSIKTKILDDARSCCALLQKRQSVELPVLELDMRQLEILRTYYFSKLQRGGEDIVRAFTATYEQNMARVPVIDGHTYTARDGYRAVGIDY